MFQKTPSTYYAKILNRSGAVMTYVLADGVTTATAPMPLDAGTIEFTRTCFVPGSNQQDVGSFSIQLRDTAHDPTAAHLQPIYDALTYEQFVEIYDRADLLGDPKFVGVIKELPDDLERSEIRGVGVLNELEKRRLRRYHTITGNAGAAVESLLKTYDVVFKDNFNRTSGIGANWTPGADYSIVANAIQKSTATAQYLKTATSFTNAQWRASKTSFDFYWDASGTNSQIALYYDSDVHDFIIYHPTNYGGDDAQISGSWVDTWGNGGSRKFFLDYGTWHHVDFYIDGTTVTLVVNGVEIIQGTIAPSANASTMDIVLETSGSAVKIDNFVFATATSALTKGAFEATAETIDQTFNGDTQLDAIRWIANKTGSWLYRVNPKAGKGASTFDFGSDIGRDLSSVIVLEPGKNIVNMQRNRTSDGLATSLYLAGQSQDDASAAFISNDLDAFDTFGIIEQSESDERVVDNATAKAIADWQLTNRSAGNVSLSGTIVDESALFAQTPVSGWATAGDFISGGRQELREGDQVWLTWTAKNIDRKVRIIAITRASGSNAVNVVFDYFPWRRKDELARLRGDLKRLNVAYLNRRNPRNFHFSFAANETQTRYFYPVGNIVSTRLDIRLASGSPTYKVYLDGTDRTLALFGAATLTATAHAIDTTYLLLAGEHSIGIEVTANQPGVFDVDVQPGVLS